MTISSNHDDQIAMERDYCTGRNTKASMLQHVSHNVTHRAIGHVSHSCSSSYALQGSHDIQEQFRCSLVYMLQQDAHKAIQLRYDYA